MEHTESIKKRKITERLGFRISLAITIPLFILFLIVAAFYGKRNYKRTRDEVIGVMKAENEVIATDVQAYMSGVVVAANQLAHNIKDVLNLPKERRNIDLVKATLNSTAGTNSEILAFGIYMEPNSIIFREEDSSYNNKRWGLYVQNTGDNKGEILSSQMDINSENFKWYKDSLELKEPGFLNAKFNPYLKALTTYYVVPIIENNKTIGVSAIAIDIGFIQENLKKLSHQIEDGSRVLVNKDANIIGYDKNDELLMQNILDIGVPEKKGIYERAYNGEVVVEQFKTAPENGSIRAINVVTPISIPGVKEKWLIDTTEAVDKVEKRAIFSVLAIIGLAIFILLAIDLILLIVLRKYISKPLELLEKSLYKLSHYDLNLDEEREHSEAYLKRDDEISAISTALWVTVKHLKEIIISIDGLSQNTAATAEELTATAQSTQASAMEVSNAVENIAEGATSQAEDSSNAASAVEVQSNLQSDAINNVSYLLEIVERINERKDEGTVSIKELISISKESAQASDSVAVVISETSRAAEKISDASEMIQSISDQTNLLALNAAIDIAVVM